MKLHYRNYLKSYAKDLRQSGNMAEVLLWGALKNNQLGYRFLRQRPIGDYIVDFYCLALKLAIEIDGAASHDSKTEEDEKRQRILELAGVKVLRFTDTEVRNNLQGVVMAIRGQIPPASGVLPFLKVE